MNPSSGPSTLEGELDELICIFSCCRYGILFELFTCIMNGIEPPHCVNQCNFLYFLFTKMYVPLIVILGKTLNCPSIIIIVIIVILIIPLTSYRNSTRSGRLRPESVYCFIVNVRHDIDIVHFQFAVDSILILCAQLHVIAFALKPFHVLQHCIITANDAYHRSILKLTSIPARIEIEIISI